MAKKIVTWILVADSKQARLYANDGPGKGLYQPIAHNFIANLPSKVRDIVSDREGRSRDPTGRGHHALDARTDPRQHLRESFLRDVAGTIESMAKEKFFDRLVIAASPRALGELRQGLGRHSRAMISAELDKDLVALDQVSLEKHLIDADAIL
jgi:protein required for attachment to host cells